MSKQVRILMIANGNSSQTLLRASEVEILNLTNMQQVKIILIIFLGIFVICQCSDSSQPNEVGFENPMEAVGIAHNESLRFILPEVTNNSSNVIQIKGVIIPFLKFS